MRIYTTEIEVATHRARELVDITAQARDAVRLILVPKEE
jgi:thiamine phosphate synthase YjbQ (UPF0047 family)